MKNKIYTPANPSWATTNLIYDFDILEVRREFKIQTLILLFLFCSLGLIIFSNLIVKNLEKVFYQEPIVINLISKVKAEESQEIIGIASWYDYQINGIWWSKNHLTCASRDYPRYSTLKVINLDNGKSVECFVNDFGPEEWTGRIIDLSSYAFSQLAPLDKGLINIKIEKL